LRLSGKRLPDYKVSDYSSSCSNCLTAGRDSSYNILRDFTAIFRGILEEKRRFNRERETAIAMLKETTAKIAYLEEQLSKL
jgi:hypothetical protein